MMGFGFTRVIRLDNKACTDFWKAAKKGVESWRAFQLMYAARVLSADESLRVEIRAKEETLNHVATALGGLGVSFETELEPTVTRDS